MHMPIWSPWAGHHRCQHCMGSHGENYSCCSGSSWCIGQLLPQKFVRRSNSPPRRCPAAHSAQVEGGSSEVAIARVEEPLLCWPQLLAQVGDQMLLKAFGPLPRRGCGLRSESPLCPLCPCSSSGRRPQLQHSGSIPEGFSIYGSTRGCATRCSLSQRSLADQRKSLVLCH